MVQLLAALQEQGLTAQLLLKIHDEHVLEVEPEILDRAHQLVNSKMGNASQTNVPLHDDRGVGANWREAK